MWCVTRYVISTLELLVVEDYMIVYFHGSTPKHKMPGLRWLKRCYDMIDRRWGPTSFCVLINLTEKLITELTLSLLLRSKKLCQMAGGYIGFFMCNRLRKNLKGLLIVHPTLWLKTVVLMTKPFIRWATEDTQWPHSSLLLNSAACCMFTYNVPYHNLVVKVHAPSVHGLCGSIRMW